MQAFNGTPQRRLKSTMRFPFASARLLVSLGLLLLGLLVLASSGQGTGPLLMGSDGRTALLQTASLETRGAVLAPCLPLDIPCYLGQISDTLVTNAFGTVRPLLDGIQQSAYNFVTQTPADLTYANQEVQRAGNWSVTVVDAALLVILGCAGYQVMMGRALGWSTTEVMALMPRIALAVLVAHLWQFVTALLIDLNNALCLSVSHLLGLTLLQDMARAVINTVVNPLTGGQQGLLLLFSIWVACLLLLLVWQMLVRLALVIVCVALAPLGLLCLALPLTENWGRVWLSIFSHTILIQFFQVMALALSGLLVGFLTRADLFHLDPAVISLLVGGTMLFLVRQLPALLREYALRPIMRAGEQSGQALGTVVTRLVAIG